MAAVLLDRCADMYREERLRPLKTYRYQGVDRSFVSRYVLAPYWNWVVTLFPLWMAYPPPVRPLTATLGRT